MGGCGFSNVMLSVFAMQENLPRSVYEHDMIVYLNPLRKKCMEFSTVMLNPSTHLCGWVLHRQSDFPDALLEKHQQHQRKVLRAAPADAVIATKGCEVRLIYEARPV